MSKRRVQIYELTYIQKISLHTPHTDSLTLQHMDTIDNLLRPNNGPVLANFTSGINRSIYLDLEHPDTLVLIAEAGVSIERASLPLVTWWRTNLLASDEQLQEIFRETGLYKYRDDAVVDWYPSLLARWQGVPPTRNYAEGIVEEPNVVMVEVGTHWIGAELGYLIKEEDLITGWYRMVSFPMKLCSTYVLWQPSSHFAGR